MSRLAARPVSRLSGAGGRQGDGLGLGGVRDAVGVGVNGHADDVVGPQRWVHGAGGPRPDQGTGREVNAGTVPLTGRNDQQLAEWCRGRRCSRGIGLTATRRR